MPDSDNKQVEQQLINLASDNLEIYQMTHAWFIQQGPKISATLVKGLDDPLLGSVCHWRILILLRYFANEETLPAILKTFHRALACGDNIVLPGAMEAMAVFHATEVTNALIALLRESNLDIVKHAAALIGQTDDLNAIDPLLHLLGSDDPGVRYSAARGLIQLEYPSARTALKTHLEGETDVEIRELIESADIWGPSDNAK